MRISRVQISNFANFSEIDIETGASIVVVGENQVGKSNFIRALQLILDPTLSERDRHLGVEHFWDGLGEDKIGALIEISIELTDFTDDPRPMAHLNDCVVDPGPQWSPALRIASSQKPTLTANPRPLPTTSTLSSADRIRTWRFRHQYGGCCHWTCRLH